MKWEQVAHERLDTWDEGWEARLEGHVRAAGYAGVWDYARARPGLTYDSLAEELSAGGGFGVVGVQVERLQVRDTPEDERARSIRDALARHLRAAFLGVGWRNGPYWESRALGALAAWSAMWSARVDVAPIKRRVFDMAAPSGWIPEDGSDPFLLSVVPEPNP